MAVSHLLSVLVLGAVVNAAPPLLSNIRTSMPMSASTSVSASAIAGTPTVAATTPAASASAAAIVIPESVIDAAPILDLEVTSPLNTIKGDGTNSTLTDARPDLKEYVDTTVVTDNNATTSKRNLVKRIPSPWDCNPNQVPHLNVEVYAWEHIITRICKQWYPNPSSYEWDPASPRPNYLKAATLGPLYVGNGQVINFDFKYGVNDWGLQAAYDWQTYYVPQSQELCIADLKTLIQDMHNSCLFGTGYDTSQDLSGSGQPKWYTFMAS